MLSDICFLDFETQKQRINSWQIINVFMNINFLYDQQYIFIAIYVKSVIRDVNYFIFILDAVLYTLH